MFKIFRKNCCGLDVHKTWIYACIGITYANGRTDYKQARFSSFSKGLRELADWLAKYGCRDVCMESAGKYWIPVFNILEKTCFVTLAHPKYTKPQKGNKTDRKDAKWICDLFMCDMIKPSFIPPPDIRHLRDLVRYRFKLTNCLTGEKNRAQNCLTVSNLKLDDVFSDVFGKSARSITNHILEHPGEPFDVALFVDKRCKHPIEEIQAAVDGSISQEQATKLREVLRHIDEIKVHKLNIEAEILRLAAPYKALLELLHTVPGFSADPMTAIAVLSEIGADMSVFQTAKNLSSWAGCCPHNDQSGGKRKSTRISRAGAYLKPLLVQVQTLLSRPTSTLNAKSAIAESRLVVVIRKPSLPSAVCS
jgi:transposase